MPNWSQVSYRTGAKYLIEAENQYKASPYFAIRADYYEARQSCEIDDHMILYEAFYGRGITCNPGALFRYLLSDARFSDYTHVWVLEESADRDRIIAEFADKANVRFVEPFTNDYLKYLSTAKYLINNSTWPNYFSKKRRSGRHQHLARYSAKKPVL